MWRIYGPQLQNSGRREMQAQVSPDGRVLTVSLPLSIRKRGGRKQVVVPAGSPPWLRSRARVDGTLVKALARASLERFGLARNQMI